MNVGITISIVMPAYNVEKYLSGALNSIARQTMLPDELILVDDGSTDGTLLLAESYSFSIPYKVVSIKNSGQGVARNTGASLATSEYIYFFDSDDVLKEEFIASMKSCIAFAGNPDIIFFSGRSFNDEEYTGSRWIDYHRGFSGKFESREQFLDRAYKAKGLFCSPCLYVSKKSLWGALKFKQYYFEDEAIFFPLLFSCSTFVVLDKVFFLRRNREGSTMTMSPNVKHVSGALLCMLTNLELYKSAKFSSRERWHILKRLEVSCVTYIRTANCAKVAVEVSGVLSVILAAKSVKLATKVMLWYAFSRQLEWVRRVTRRHAPCTH